jgi:hypothetical protein
VSAGKVARHVVVLGLPGSAGEAVAAALAAATGGRAAAAPAAVDDALLRVLRATRTTPPDLASGWEDWPELGQEREAARAALRDTAASRVTFWYDALAATLLPFWQRHAGAPELVVLAWRAADPVYGAFQREGLAPAHARALGARLVRDTLRAPAGLPVLVVDVDRLLDEPELEAVVVERALEARGFVVSQGALSAALADELRAHPSSSERDERADVMPWPAPARGLHACWTPPSTSSTPDWCDALLAAELRAHRAALEATEGWRAAAADAGMRDAAFDAARLREIWRMRDQVRRLEGEHAAREARLAELEVLVAQAEARVLELQARFDDPGPEGPDAVRRERDELRAAHAALLGSREWKVGRVMLRPVRWVQRQRPEG